MDIKVSGKYWRERLEFERELLMVSLSAYLLTYIVSKSNSLVTIRHTKLPTPLIDRLWLELWM